ncbi:FAD binding domain-containing protein [Natrarchaeobius oligotrophus]|uniref:Xanthine dehydrogenase family protein subunit M n=1 Tax=Natrarchaeobius chitinivorans TaxID=1679083 RepID=A0A3N6PLU3_NATCH|nr:xanthine dehydrogenase family protein subunit M [Natrarchaeobius chitinivorans]RQH02480.1 xanthine dehydrogenase family protein subunit M [Natrarchaeobius chitinivorans]
MSAQTEYYRPETVDSVCQMLDELTDPTIVAGMQSLGLLMKEGIVSPDTLVDINGVEGLGEIERDDDHVTLGAVVNHSDVERSDVVHDAVPVLAEAAGEIADLQIRNAGTIGGATAYADPTGDYPPVLMALAATIVSRTTDDEIERDAGEFFTGFYECALGPTELLTEIRVPRVGDGEGVGYEKLAYRENDRAVVNVASYLSFDGDECETARIVVGSVSDRPIAASDAAAELVGTEVTDEELEAAAAAAAEEVPVDPDPSVSAEYRQSMVRNLAEKTLRTAREEART